MDIQYRVTQDAETLEQMVDLEISIWGLEPRDAVPSHMLHAVAANGGVLLVAEVDQRLVGAAMGFPARRGREWILWSHMAGVHPDYQGQGIGFELKQAQRRWALEHGFKRIGWTFDPLQRGNANFNIHQLGATSNLYHVDYYGVMLDGINAGLPSDRLEVTWKLTGRPTASRIDPEHLTKASFLVSADSRDHPQSDTLPSNAHVVCVEIPSNLTQMKQEDRLLALEWRLSVRDAFRQAFEQGYTIVDFQNIERRCAYVLAEPVPWFMYVVECKDHSLYTGIALDVAQRVSRHNAGKGAAYTSTRRPVRLLAAWRYKDHGAALRAEAAFKKQRRDEKFALIQSQSEFEEGVFTPKI